MIHILVNRLSDLGISYHWSQVWDDRNKREIDVVVIGDVLVLATHLNRFSSKEFNQLLEGLLNG